MTLAAQSEPTDLSFALAPLQQVAASLRRARAGWLPTRDERAHLFAMIPRLGPAVFPQLLRSLGSDCDDEAHWAGQLLRQASVPEVAVRLRKQALQDGLRPLRVGGAMKVAEGVTTMDEVLRATPGWE